MRCISSKYLHKQRQRRTSELKDCATNIGWIIFEINPQASSRLVCQIRFQIVYIRTILIHTFSWSMIQEGLLLPTFSLVAQGTQTPARPAREAAKTRWRTLAITTFVGHDHTINGTHVQSVDDIPAFWPFFWWYSSRLERPTHLQIQGRMQIFDKKENMSKQVPTALGASASCRPSSFDVKLLWIHAKCICCKNKFMPFPSEPGGMREAIRRPFRRKGIACQSFSLDLKTSNPKSLPISERSSASRYLSGNTAHSARPSNKYQAFWLGR